MGGEALKVPRRRKNASTLHNPQNAARRPIGKAAMHRLRAAESYIGKKCIARGTSLSGEKGACR